MTKNATGRISEPGLADLHVKYMINSTEVQPGSAHSITKIPVQSAALNGQPEPYQGETDIFISPGFQFNCVDALLTNFHLPKSTLLMLVSAFAGTEFMRRAYGAAIEEQYRFFSYGDAMLII